MSENEEKSLDPLLALIALSEKATAGPWRWSESGNIVPVASPSFEEVAAVYTERDDDAAPANAEFIIALVNWFRENADSLRAANARGDGAWRDPVTDAPQIGQRVLVAHKMGRHTVVGAATYWNYKKGVHDDDSGPDWQLHEYDFLGTIVAWKEIPEYTPPTTGSEVRS